MRNRIDERIEVESRQIGIFCLNEGHIWGVIPKREIIIVELNIVSCSKDYELLVFYLRLFQPPTSKHLLDIGVYLSH
jgi:hypothetical protein